MNVFYTERLNMNLLLSLLHNINVFVDLVDFGTFRLGTILNKKVVPAM